MQYFVCYSTNNVTDDCKSQSSFYGGKGSLSTVTCFWDELISVILTSVPDLSGEWDARHCGLLQVSVNIKTIEDTYIHVLF